MRLKIGPSLLVLALIAGAGVALLQRPGTIPQRNESSATTKPIESMTPGSETLGTAAPGAGAFEPALPPNHPAIDPQRRGVTGAREEAVALAWTVPPGWETTPSRSSIRLATYRVPGSSKGGAPAELTVTRAGGSTEDNLERWIGQFNNPGTDSRAARTVAGLRVTTLDVSGTYDGGMSSSGSDASHAGWALRGSVVETQGSFYFFKMVGPADSVLAARPAFDALISSVRNPS